MTTYLIPPIENCKFCHGTGEVHEAHPYGSTYAIETLICDCVLKQLPEDFEDSRDMVEIEPLYSGPICEDGPEFEYDELFD